VYCLHEKRGSIFSFRTNYQKLILFYSPKYQIEGEVSLKQTTLRSLGLANGKAAMRLLVRPKNASKEQAFVESLNLKKPSDSKEHLQIDEPVVTDKGENVTNTQSTSAQQSSPLPLNTDNTKTSELESQNSKRQLENSQPIAVSNDIPIAVNEKPKDEKVVEEETQEMEVENVESSDESNDVINYVKNCIKILISTEINKYLFLIVGWN